MSFFLKRRQAPMVWSVCVAAAAVLLAVPLSSLADMLDHPAPDVRTSPEAATSQFFDTLLTITPQISYYQKAVLRVSGPNDYSLTEYFENNASISVDLLAEREPLEGGREYSSRSNRMDRLPPGYYNYEVVFYEGSGNQQVHAGNFRIP